MTPEEYLITTHVGEVARKQLWQADETADLDLPGGWIIEMQDGGIRVFDSAVRNDDDTVRELTVPSFKPGEKVAIDLPPSARDRWRRPIRVELDHIRKPAPVYVVSSDIQTLEKPGPKQPFLFYGQDFLLVHHRPVRLSHRITLLGYDIFSFSQESNGDFIVKSNQSGLRVESDSGVKKLAKGSEVRLAGVDFFGATFRLRKHWWRLRLFPSADGLNPVETDETEEDRQERERLHNSMAAILLLFSLLIFAGYLVAKFSRPAPKIVHANVILKTPIVMPPFKQPKKPVAKKIKKKKKRIVLKKHEVVKLTKHLAQQQHPVRRRIVKPIRKRVAHVRRHPIAAAPRLIHPPHRVTRHISPAVARANALAKQRAAQQAQVTKELKFLSSSSSLPQSKVAYYKTKKGRYANTTMIGGVESKSDELDRIAKGAPGSGAIHTRNSQEVSSNVSFGDRGKGLNRVQGRVSLTELNSGGGTLSGALGGGSGIYVSGPGTMSNGVIEGILQKYLSQFEYCYEKALLSDASLAGSLRVQWDITTAGRVSHSQILKSQLNNAQLHHCVLHVLGKIRFPRPRGGYVTVQKTFSFKSGSI